MKQLLGMFTMWFVLCSGLIFIANEATAASCGSPFSGNPQAPRWDLIKAEIDKANKHEYYRPVQVRENILVHVLYDEEREYIVISKTASMLVPEAREQFKIAVREWIKKGIEYGS